MLRRSWVVRQTGFEPPEAEPLEELEWANCQAVNETATTAIPATKNHHLVDHQSRRLVLTLKVWPDAPVRGNH